MSRRLPSSLPLVALAAASLVACSCGAEDTAGKTGSTATEPGDLTQFPIPDPFVISVTGSDYRWHLRYPGADGELGTADDVHSERHIHVPVGARTRLELASNDFLYTLKLPELGLKEIAVPELEFSLEFDAREEGTFQLLGDNFCGYSHEELIGTLVVESPDAFSAHLRAASNEFDEPR